MQLEDETRINIFHKSITFFSLSFLLVHQDIVITDILECYIGFLLKEQSKNVL